MALGDTVMSSSKRSYHVDIQHPGRNEWNQIHGLAWETTKDLEEARQYAKRVAVDHPGSQVRIILNIAIRHYNFSTGKWKTMVFDPRVVI
ncbi:hypothetical protein [Polymorphospora sp. NPDC050346]|uniref:hypothetical protein n=1 Tax=Polymorphospora sp. NPDC050346 TaxID=3155780 RepID=UPI0033E6260C